MTDLDETTQPVDGRVVRRQRNIDAVLDVVLQMFTEDSMFPTIEQAATRSGLSLRSLYRYFANPGELLEAAIKRSNQIGAELSHLDHIGEGDLDQRIEDFVAMRLKLYHEIGPMFRATSANAARHPRIGEEQARNRRQMRRQFELQFAPELRAMSALDRDATIAAGDLLTQLGSVDYLRRDRELTAAKAAKALTSGLRAVLSMAS